MVETATRKDNSVPIINDALLEKISHIKLFNGLERTDLNLICNQLILTQVKAGENLLIQGKPVNAVFFIKEGIVDILVNEDRIAQRSSFDTIGEMSCLSQEELASATVQAITPCSFWFLKRVTFLQLVNSIPRLRAKSFTLLSNRLKQLSHRFGEILKHIPHGIIKINLDGMITDEYSSRCLDYLGVKPLTGENLGELLFCDDQQMKEQWDQVLQAMAKDNININLNSRIGELPSETTYRHPSGQFRIFKLFYNVSVNTDNRIIGLDVGLEDETQNRSDKTELGSYQNLIAKMEQLLVLVDSETGIIIQETISQSHLGQSHFPAWKNLKGKRFDTCILISQSQDSRSHLKKWLAMLKDPYITETMTMKELVDLAPKFAFETVLGEAVELVFTLNPSGIKQYAEVLGQFIFIENATDGQNPNFSTIQLMEEVMAAESKHQASLTEALNEIEISLDIAQSKMTTPKELAKNYQQVAGMIHSVKGLGQSFELATLAIASHDLEDVLDDVVSSGQNPVAMEKLVESFKTLLSLVVISKSLCSAEKALDLGNLRTRSPEIRISGEQYKHMRKQLHQMIHVFKKSTLDKQSLAILISFEKKIRTLELMKLDAVFPRLERIIKDTAKLLNKDIDFIAHNGSGMMIPFKICFMMNACLIQLVKNAANHGIETVSQRKFLRKSEKASIELITAKNDDWVEIRVRDNGRGVNIRKTVKRAIEMNLLDSDTAVQYLKEKRYGTIMGFLWKSGFSTAESISLISGRGMGLSMIKTEIESFGGSVQMLSAEGKGAEVKFTVPLRAT